MFKRFNRAKMLALVASLGAFGANVNSNAGAVNKAVPVAAGAAGGLLTGIIGMAAFVKYSNFGKKLAFSNELKYLAEVIKEAKVDALCIKIDDFAVKNIKLDDERKTKVNNLLKKRFKSIPGYDDEKIGKMSDEEKVKVYSKFATLLIGEAVKFNGGLNCLSFEFGKMLNNIEISGEIMAVCEKMKEIKVSADRKGNLNFSLLINDEYVQHSAKDAKNVDEKQKAIDEYIDKIKNALEKHPVIQAIKESKSEDKNFKPSPEIV